MILLNNSQNTFLIYGHVSNVNIRLRNGRIPIGKLTLHLGAKHGHFVFGSHFFY